MSSKRSTIDFFSIMFDKIALTCGKPSNSSKPDSSLKSTRTAST
ncbi:Uncharacterised protein [Mycobacteroides abscessus subsp. abscessus]|nr:Uncharacterised protein [Mycobacteroides abscessus subsp. abscessus]